MSSGITKRTKSVTQKQQKNCPSGLTAQTGGRRVRSNFVTKQQLIGQKFSPPSNPPDVNYQPWFAITLVFTAVSTLELTVKEVALRLRAQLDPTSRGMNHTSTGDLRYIVQLRFQSISAWNLTANARLLALTVDDFHDVKSASGGREQLCGIVDTGGSATAPKVGYRMPLSHQSLVLRNDDQQSEIVIAKMQGAQNDQILCHLHTLFRFDGPVVLPTIFPTPLDIATSTVTNKLETIYQQMPTTTTFGVPPVSIEAAAVYLPAPLLGEEKNKEQLQQEVERLTSQLESLRATSSQSSFEELKEI